MLKVLLFLNYYTELDFKNLCYVMVVLQYTTIGVPHYKFDQIGHKSGRILKSKNCLKINKNLFVSYTLRTLKIKNS